MPSTRRTQTYRRQVIQFLVVFTVLCALSSALETTMMSPDRGRGERDEAIRRLQRVGHAYQRVIAQSVAQAAHLFRHDVYCQGRKIGSRGPSLVVTAQCSAVLATGFFCSAVLAFPCRWSRKLVGLIVGLLGVAVLNWIRIFVLAMVASTRQEWFAVTHDILMQGFLLIMVAPLWMAWLLWAWRPKAPRGGAAVAADRDPAP